KWIEDGLINEKVAFISFNEFTDLEQLDTGGFGSIVKATWLKTGECIVFKTLVNTNTFRQDTFIDGYPPPFKDKNSGTISAIIINNKARENTIPDTPINYESLYKKCWDQEPEQRPTITEILEEFLRMKFVNKPIKSNNLFGLFNNKLNNKVKVIHFNELIDLKPLDEGAFGSIIKATWSKKNNYIVCKKLKRK
ncbi:13266_t:CDS:2, partial [Funneliformis mosseae]